MTDTEKKSKDMWTSVSAITEAVDCLRHWWLHKRCKIPQDQRSATIFGDVHHAVCARFLEADDRGVDPKTGKPVDLYPKDWMQMENRFEDSGKIYKVSDTEAALIKALVQKAITEGVLLREPGRTVEREFETAIWSKGYAKVILKGFIDVDTPRGIEDHKTTKNKKYLLSKAKLKKSIQMMGYAYERYLKGHQGNIWLAHNGFVKDFDEPLVKKTEVEVTQIEVMDFFNNDILPVIKKMFRYYTEYPPARIDKWRSIPPANNANQSCNHHYGAPCPYVMICSGLATIDQYLMKYGMTVKDITEKTETEHIEKGSQMNSLMNKVKEEQAAQAQAKAAGAGAAVETTTPPVETAVVVEEQPTTPAASGGGLTAMLAKVQAGHAAAEVVAEKTEAPVETTTAVVEETVPVTPVKQAAPWYTFQEGEAACPACVDNAVLGYNSKTEPCLICVNRAAAAGKPGPDDYTVDVLEDGRLQFTAMGTTESTTVQVASEPETKVVIEPVAEQVSGQSVVDTVKAATALVDAATALVDSKTEVKEIPALAQQSMVGFDMLIGCNYAKMSGTIEVVYIDVLLEVMLTEISEVAGKSWSLLDHFELMQAVDAYVPNMVPHIQGQTVVSIVPAKGSAHARLVDGLRQEARIVIYPFGG